MPTNRRFRSRTPQQELSLGAIAYLRDDPYDPGLGNALWPGNEHSHLSAHGDTPYSLQGDAARQACGLSARELVERYGDQFLAEYIADHPGQRPHWWWAFNVLDNGQPLRRQRIGGVGVTHGDDHFSYGIPTGWVTRMDQTEERTWPGKPFHPGPAVDPANPPIFESQAAYLDRHGLLMAGERKRLTDADFAPDVVELAGYDLVDDDVGDE
jgi:hypothetical protein